MILRELTREEIAKLANRKGVKKIAVENFLSSMGNVDSWVALQNLEYDTHLYKWNKATVRAIHRGIELACKVKKFKK
jgi:hypothetical protein